MYPDVDPNPLDERPPSSWTAFSNFQRWVMAAIAVALIPSAIAGFGGVAINGGHALQGTIAIAVDVVLVLSLTAGLVVLGIGLKRFLSAQAEIRRYRNLQKKQPGA